MKTADYKKASEKLNEFIIWARIRSVNDDIVNLIVSEIIHIMAVYVELEILKK